MFIETRSKIVEHGKCGGESHKKWGRLPKLDLSQVQPLQNLAVLCQVCLEILKAISHAYVARLVRALINMLPQLMMVLLVSQASGMQRWKRKLGPGRASAIIILSSPACPVNSSSSEMR